MPSGGASPGGAVVSRGCSCLRSALPLARARTAPTNLKAPATLLVQLRQLHPLIRKLNRVFKFSVCKVTKYVNKL